MAQIPDENDRTKTGKELKKFSPFTSLMVGGLCKSLKDVNEYRLSVLEKIRKQLGLLQEKKK